MLRKKRRLGSTSKRYKEGFQQCLEAKPPCGFCATSSQLEVHQWHPGKQALKTGDN